MMVVMMVTRTVRMMLFVRRRIGRRRMRRLGLRMRLSLSRGPGLLLVLFGLQLLLMRCGLGLFLVHALVRLLLGVLGSLGLHLLLVLFSLLMSQVLLMRHVPLMGHVLLMGHVPLMRYFLLMRHVRLVLMLRRGLGLLLLRLLFGVLVLGLLLMGVHIRLLLGVLGRLGLLLLMLLHLLLMLLRLQVGALLVEPGLGGDLVVLVLLGQDLLFAGLLLGLLVLRLLLLLRLLRGLLLVPLVLLVGIMGDQGAGHTGHHGGDGNVGAAMVADRCRRRSLVIVMLPVVKGVGFLVTAILFALPVGGLFGGVFVVIGAPFGFAALLRFPIGAGGVDLGPARRPIGGADLPAFPVQRGGIDVAGAGQFARRAVGIAVLFVGRQRAAVAVVDDGEFAAVVITI